MYKRDTRPGGLHPHPSPLPSRERVPDRPYLPLGEGYAKVSSRERGQETIRESVIEEIRRDVGRLSRGLFEHILRVEGIAVGLAEAHGIDVQKVRVAALLHDLARARRPEELLAMAEGFGIEVGQPESRMPIFLHGPVAAEMARGRYGVEDEEILEAVRAHTTGLPGMGPVARAVFLADKLDPTKDRRYPFNGRVREMAGRDLDGALLAFLEGEIAGREAGGGVVHPASVGLREGVG